MTSSMLWMLAEWKRNGWVLICCCCCWCRISWAWFSQVNIFPGKYRSALLLLYCDLHHSEDYITVTKGVCMRERERGKKKKAFWQVGLEGRKNGSCEMENLVPLRLDCRNGQSRVGGMLSILNILQCLCRVQWAPPPPLDCLKACDGLVVRCVPCCPVYWLILHIGLCTEPLMKVHCYEKPPLF